MHEPFARIAIARDGQTVYLIVRGREEFVTADAARATEFQSVQSAVAYVARREIENATIEPVC